MLIGLSVFPVMPAPSWASADSVTQSPSDASEIESHPSPRWYNAIDYELGGQIKVQGSVSWPDDESYFQPVGTAPLYDGSTQVRLKNKLFWGERAVFETHYEAVLSGGDTRRKEQTLQSRYPALFATGLLASDPPSDRRRLMDLTSTIDEDDSHVLYHRLDRLCLTVTPPWGTLCIGRQAVTWGNGFLFNPMDLLNPFSPSDIAREYKVGDDMISTRFPLTSAGSLQLLYVPRREVTGGDVTWGQSSLAGKLHLTRDTTEFDIMAAKHYEDAVIGCGGVGYIGNAAWRLNATYTFLDDSVDGDDYLSVVANVDYSWVWFSKNFYGYVEYYFNGLCHNRYSEAYSDRNIAERIDRGELFTLGRNYLSGHIRVELHPLFNVYVTVINNVADPSGSLQPRAVWDVSQNVQITCGGNIYYGEKDTEYGGFRIAGTKLYAVPSNSAFVWLAYYF